MRLSFATPQIDALRHEDAEEQIRQIAAMGYAAVEYLINDPAKVDRVFYDGLHRRHGIKVSGLRTGSIYAHTGWRLSHPDAAVRARAVERVKGVIELAGHFGCDIMVGLMQGHLDPGETVERAKDHIVECLRECSAFAKGHGVTIMYEPVNRFELEYNNTIEEMIRMADRINAGGAHPVKLLLDVYHMHLEDPSVAYTFVRGMKYMGHVHFSDSNRCAPGMGSIDFVEATKILYAMDYDGYVTVEVLDKPDMLTAARRSMDYLAPIFAVAERARKG